MSWSRTDQGYTHIDYNVNTYKDFWRNMELVHTAVDKQLPFLLEQLKLYCDISKVETILEVGVGYGRIAKGILDTFDNIDTYFGIDISENAIKQSEEYLKEYSYCYVAKQIDFEEYDTNRLFDMVISVEFMSALPHKDIQPFINKMVKLSKKYVVNVDYSEDTHMLINNVHSYGDAYAKSGNTVWVDSIKYNRETMYIARVD